VRFHSFLIQGLSTKIIKLEKNLTKIKMLTCVGTPSSKNLLPQPLGKDIKLFMKKSLAPWICSVALLPFVSCVHLSNTSTDPLTFSTDQTVMLHWLEVDDTGVVREAEIEGNLTKQGEPFSGKAIETFEQSPTKSISSWKDGQRHGITLEYFYNGRKRTSIVYKNGNRHGPSQEFRITGELWREETYQEDQLTGPKSEWHPNGIKSFQVEMREGVAHGEAKEWYSNGAEKSSSIYRHGLREGPSSEWYPSGQQKLGLFYQKDQQHGLRTIWYENGKKRLSAQFIDDKMEGNSKGWFPSGQQQFDYNFKNNLEHGICTEWNDSGEKISEIRFNNGIPAQDLLTGQRIAPPSPPVTVDGSQDQDKETVTENNATESDELQKVDLPPLPETENATESIVPAVKISEPIKARNDKNDQPKANDSQEVKTEPLPTSVSPQIPVFTDEVPQTEKPANNQPIKELPKDSPPPPPTFDPFGDLAPPAKPEANEPSITPSLKPENPPEKDSLMVPNSNEVPDNSVPSSSLPSSFDPFGETTPPATPTNPFEETQPQSNTENPFDTPPSFDPFGENPEKPKNNNKRDGVPLEDIFSSPPSAGAEENKNSGIPPPPTFDPFEN
jgi:antitoxin component YwqK of YwqJK toxin-antitoxin module